MDDAAENRQADYMHIAVDLAAEQMRQAGGGPFGAIIVRGSEIVGRGWNQVTRTNDPTAHAEVVAIRAAAAALRTFNLAGCVLYSSCEPCPMCLAAAYWARLDRVFFAADRHDATAAGFDDEQFYAEFGLPTAERRLPLVQLSRAAAVAVFDEWRTLPNKIPY